MKEMDEKEAWRKINCNFSRQKKEDNHGSVSRARLETKVDRPNADFTPSNVAAPTV